MPIKEYIKIINSSSGTRWHDNRVGDVFEVKELNPSNVADWIKVWVKRGKLQKGRDWLYVRRGDYKVVATLEEPDMESLDCTSCEYREATEYNMPGDETCAPKKVEVICCVNEKAAYHGHVVPRPNFSFKHHSEIQPPKYQTKRTIRCL